MAPFMATLILNLHCFSSLLWSFTGPVTSPLTSHILHHHCPSPSHHPLHPSSSWHCFPACFM
jgi:hypothetical protein